MSQEQRRSERIDTNVKVQIMRGGVYEPAVAADVNAHGLFIRSACRVQRGELLKLIVELPDGPMHACAVVHTIGQTKNGWGLGVELFGVNGREHARWHQFYRSLVVGRREVTAVPCAA